MTVKTVGLFVSLVAYWLSFSSAQAIMIDPFENGSLEVGVNAGSPPQIQTDGSAVTEALGGSRELQAYASSLIDSTNYPSYYILGQSCGACTPHVYYHAQLNVIGDTKVHWDGVNEAVLKPAGLGGVDLTDGGASTGFEIKVDYLAAGLNLALQVWDNGSTASASLSSLLLGTNFVPFADFTGTVNWASIDAIQMVISYPAAAVGQAYIAEIDYIRTNSSVPEPATLALFGLGLAGIGAVWRRRTIN